LLDSSHRNIKKQSADEIEGKKAHITTYDEMPIGSSSKNLISTTSTYNLQNSRFEPNFKSNAYKKQAKEIYERRM